jgi:hypothetical protein
MVLKNVLLGVACTALLTSSVLSMADEYRPGEYFGLDLSRAVLSPRPLGPPAEFAPVPLEAKTDRGPEAEQARDEAKAGPKIAARKTGIAHREGAQARVAPKVQPKLVARRAAMAHAHVAKPRSAVRSRLARSRGNPLDAQASDTRVQVWPCNSGGICNWKR